MQTVPAFSYMHPARPAVRRSVPTTAMHRDGDLRPAARRSGSRASASGRCPTTRSRSGLAFGVDDDGRLLRKVQLPLAKPAIMLGVNQTIMMALGIVVIAAIGGLPPVSGARSWTALQATARRPGARRRAGDRRDGDRAGPSDLRVERCRDREAQADDRPLRPVDHAAARRRSWLAVVTVAAVIIGRQVLRQQDLPDT